jgi:hypothetical protein
VTCIGVSRRVATMGEYTNGKLALRTPGRYTVTLRPKTSAGMLGVTRSESLAV